MLISPTAASADALDHPDPRQIAVTEQGYFLDGEAIEQAPLLGVIRRLPIDTPVRLQIDASVRFQRFITLVDVINASGLNRVAVETQVLP